MDLQRVILEVRRISISVLPYLCALSLIMGCTSGSIKGRYALAEKLWNEGEFSASVNEFEKVILQDPKSELGIKALFKMAITQTLYLSRHEEALKNLKSFLEISQDSELNAQANEQIGDILFSRLELYDQAIRHYQTLVTGKPSSVYVYRIGKSQFMLSQFSEAIKSFQEVLKKFPKSQEAARADLELAKVFYTQGEPESIQEAMKRFHQLQKSKDPEISVESKFGIALCLEELDQLESALKQFEGLLSSYPSKQVVQIRMERIKQRLAQKVQRKPK